VIDPIDLAIASVQRREDQMAARAAVLAQLGARRQPRPVLFSIELAEALGIGDRLTSRSVNPPTGVALVTEEELLSFGADRVEWGEPDMFGRYTPMLYRAER